jgi:serine/threonine protein kinase
MQGVLMPDRSLEVSRVGQYIGNYRLIRRLGKGGFAEVYLGQHLHLPRQAAIKLLLNSSLTPSENRKFRAEAQIVASLRHPHIVQILDFGIDSTSGLPYLIMDYAPDGTLRQLHPRGSILPPDTILSYLRQIASALDFAHRNNIVHRDIKPENMLLSAWEDGARDNEQNGAAIPNILLSDFGIAMLTVRRPEISLASVPELAGTPYYMAPEQLRGKAVAASDQYALGVVVYEWLCGRAPFRGNMFQIANQHLNTSPPPPSELNPQISSALEDVVLRSLSKSPTRRYPTVSAFATAFADALAPAEPPALASTIPPRVAHHIEPTIPSSRASDPPTRPASAYGVATIHSKPPASSKRRAILMALGGAIVAGGVTGGLLWMEGRQAGTGVTSSGNSTKISKPTATNAAIVDVGTTLYIFHGHSKNVLALSWSPRDDLIASGSLDKTVKIWHALSGSIVSNYEGHFDQVNTVAWSPDGVYVASGGNDKEIHVCEALTGNRIRLYVSHLDVVSSIAWSPDGKYIASGSFDKTVQVWNASTGVLHITYSKHQDVVSSIAWSPDGKYIASGSTDKTVHVWDAFTGEKVYEYDKHLDFVSAVLWSKSGKQVISASDDKTVQIWDAFSGTNNYAYREHQGAIFAIALSPNGTQVASGSSDRTIHVWNFSNAEKIFAYPKHTGAIRSVTWSPKGGQIASGGDDINVQVWQAM